MGKVIQVNFGKTKKSEAKVTRSRDEVAEIMREIQLAKGGGRVFTLEEANQVLPTIHAVTKRYSQKVDVLINLLDMGQSEEKTIEIENQVNELIQRWQDQVLKLGARPKGLWLADLDSGRGYYCWKYPEKEITHEHSYTEGYSKRVPVGTLKLSKVK